MGIPWPKRETSVLPLILVAYVLYAGIFIYRTSFIIGGERFFSLFDDAMVSMRFAQNLAAGHGPIWNPGGERVEGYTNPLWMAYMALLHLLPIAQSKTSLLVQISAALFLAANLIFVKKIVDFISNQSLFASTTALILTAFYLPLNTWGLEGMEVSVLTLILSFSVWKALQCTESNSVSPLLYCVLGASTLIRVDMAVPFLAILIFLAATNPDTKKKHLIFGITSLLLFLALQTAFRYAYYGELLPNTYYLKMTGYPPLLRISRGAYVFFQFVWNLNWILFLIPFVGLLFRPNRSIFCLLWIFSGQIAYSIYVGGDAWEHWGGSNRYLSIAMPLFFSAFAWGLSEFFRTVFQNRSTLPQNLIHSIMAALVLGSLLNFNAISGPRSLGEWLLLDKPFSTTRNRTMVKTGLLLNRITDDQATIAVIWAGAIPYFANRDAVDLLGKSDKEIARKKAVAYSFKSKFIAFYPGHMKRDYAYSIGKLKPDVVAQLWSEQEAQPHIDKYTKITVEGIELYVRKDSPHIRWDKIGPYVR